MLIQMVQDIRHARYIKFEKSVTTWAVKKR